jgi:hypothetical protein
MENPVECLMTTFETIREEPTAITMRVRVKEGASETTLGLLTDQVLARVPGPGVLAAFAAADDTVSLVDMPGSDQPDRATYGQLPHVTPLLAWQQDRPAHVVAIVDRVGADIAVYPAGAGEAITMLITGPDDEIERNAPGGWAQPRYQRRAEDSWNHNAALVADRVSRLLRGHHASLLLLAGDVRALQYLDEHLPTWTRQEVVTRRITGGRRHDRSWSQRTAQILEEVRRAAEDERTSLLAELAEGRHAGGPAVEGVRETLAALAETASASSARDRCWV